MAEPSTVSQNYDDLALVPFSSFFMRWFFFLSVGSIIRQSRGLLEVFFGSSSWFPVARFGLSRIRI